ncbi:MAG: ferritin-like protein [Pyrinomonadaceae bacterium]|nr:ferritin-like protein [Pyrinomonadaceae bacterium]
MLTSKPKNKIKRMLPGDEPEEAPKLRRGARAAIAESLPSALPQPKWVRLIREDVERLPEEARVKNIKQLRKLLRRAILIEHTTIPPYLCALYSLQEGTNQESAEVIKSVLVEEMLHWILAANVLNAIGGEPCVNEPRFIPSYPSNLLDLLNTKTDTGVTSLKELLKVDALSASNGKQSNGSTDAIEVGLLRFSEEAIDTFLEIETPVPVGGESSGNPTIGTFYKILIHGLETLEAEAHAKGKTIFTKDPERRKRQITPEHYYGSGGKAVVVTDLHTARKALKEIIFQGEGFDPRFFEKDISIGDYDEIGHFYRFNQIKQGRYYEEGDTPETGPRGATLRVDWDEVYQMKPNPTLKDYRHDPDLRAKGKAFNQGYMNLLDKMQKAFTGQPDALQEAVVYMFELKYLAGELLKNPIGAGELAAGPIFGYLGKTK